MNPLNLISSIASSLFLVLTASSIAYYIAAIAAARNFSQKKRYQDEEYLPPATIIKPLHGVDNNTYKALNSFCQQNYPRFEIIFAVNNELDPEINIVHQLIEDNPLLDLSLVVSDKVWGANNKVNNMANAIESAKYQILILADSDVFVDEKYLKRIIHPFQDQRVGMVTTMYRTRPTSWFAAFEALGTSTEFFPSVLLARSLEGMAFAFGATVAIQQKALHAIGGIKYLSNYLADDYKIGECTAKAGFKVILSDYIVEHSLNTISLKGLFLHQLRWARGNRFSRPWGTLGILFTYGSVSSLCYFLLNQKSALALLLLLVTWGLRYSLAWLVGISILRDTSARKMLLLVPLRDILSFSIWLTSWLGSDVRWNNRILRLSKGGKITEIKQNI